VITSTLAIAPPLTPVQAPSLALMLDYQPETVLRRKAALTGGKRPKRKLADGEWHQSDSVSGLEDHRRNEQQNSVGGRPLH